MRGLLQGEWPSTATQGRLSDSPEEACPPPIEALKGTCMHYPRRCSRIKKIRKQGFRARMRTKAGRKMINRKRAMGRRVNVR